MDNTKEGVCATADRELVVARLIDAPAALVFNAWTQAKQLEQWWGPSGFSNTVHEMDVVEGGITRIVMHAPDGVDHPTKFVYTDIQAARRLAYMQSDDGGNANDGATFGVAVLFEAEGQQTRVTMHMLFKTATERDEAVHAFDAVASANQTLERLAKFLKTFLPAH